MMSKLDDSFTLRALVKIVREVLEEDYYFYQIFCITFLKTTVKTPELIITLEIEKNFREVKKMLVL